MENSAVEWLYNIMYKHKGNITISEYEQAKEMEKQQIIDAYHINPLESEWKNIGIDYYNETFKPE